MFFSSNPLLLSDALLLPLPLAAEDPLSLSLVLAISAKASFTALAATDEFSDPLTFDPLPEDRADWTETTDSVPDFAEPVLDFAEPVLDLTDPVSDFADAVSDFTVADFTTPDFTGAALDSLLTDPAPDLGSDPEPLFLDPLPLPLPVLEADPDPDLEPDPDPDPDALPLPLFEPPPDESGSNDSIEKCDPEPEPDLEPLPLRALDNSTDAPPSEPDPSSEYLAP